MTTISTTETSRRGKPALAGTALLSTEPDRNCPLCPRLVGFREEARAREPRHHAPQFLQRATTMAPRGDDDDFED